MIHHGFMVVRADTEVMVVDGELVDQVGVLVGRSKRNPLVASRDCPEPPGRL